MKILYTKYTRERLPQFQTETRIVDMGNSLIVQKKPLRNEGERHITEIFNNTKILSDVYRANILESKIQSNLLIYNYVKSESLSDILIKLLEKDNIEGFYNKLQEYKVFIENLQDIPPINFHSCESFIEVFGTELSLKAARVLNPANIDLVFDNILVKDNDYIIIDCEWVFNFNVPVLFIMYRAILSFWTKYCNFISVNVSLADIIRYFEISENLVDIFNDIERNFQSMVHGENRTDDQYRKIRYSLNSVVNLINETKYPVQVLLPVNGEYTYEKTIWTNYSQQFQVLQFNFNQEFDDHFRIDPIKQSAYIIIRSIYIIVSDSENGEKRIVLADESNDFLNISYNENIRRINRETKYFSCLTVGSNNHLFIKYTHEKNEQVKGENRQYKIFVEMSATTIHDTVVRELIMNMQLLEEKNATIAEKNEQICEQKSKIYSLNSDIISTLDKIKKQDKIITEKIVLHEKLQNELESQKNNLMQNKHEFELLKSEFIQLNDQLLDIKQKHFELQNSTSWKLTKPLRFIGSLIKRKM
ncbi:hypothetical protein [Paenibacillus sp. YYML68]|uniref:hypothetical protein n=1 Tax=Paenibacillus sp. YYML68 TaxID=2909250 RepID=UPI0024920026|nr:hypothetical protein [Paenibacillus sp. YYML68]